MSRVAAYEADGFDPVRQEWLSHCAHIEGMMRIARPGKSEGLRVGADNSGMNNIVEGRFAGLGADGALHLVQDDGERHVITTGDVDLMG
jgi:biotin-(acetyl-CoA carboxylase) ligase